MEEKIQIQENELIYKGIIGSIHSMKTGENSYTYFGKLLNINKGTLAIYDGDTIDELKKDFQECVNNYLAITQERNIK